MQKLGFAFLVFSQLTLRVICVKINILEFRKNNYTNKNSGKKFLRDVLNDLQILLQLEYIRGHTPFLTFPVPSHSICGIISYKGCFSSGCRAGSVIRAGHCGTQITLSQSLIHPHCEERLRDCQLIYNVYIYVKACVYIFINSYIIQLDSNILVFIYA